MFSGKLAFMSLSKTSKDILSTSKMLSKPLIFAPTPYLRFTSKISLGGLGMLLKVKRGCDAIDFLQEKITSFTSLLKNIWIKAHFPLESPFSDFG